MSLAPDIVTEEFNRLPLRLCPGVTLTPQRRGREVFWHIGHPSTGKYFRVGTTEYALLSLFDGETSIAAAITLLARRMGKEAPTSQEGLSLGRWLVHQGLATTENSCGPKNSSHPVVKAPFHPLWWVWRFPAPTEMLLAAGKTLKPLFGTFGCLLTLAIVVLGGFNLFRQGANLWQSLPSLSAPETWLILLILWCGLKFLHEMSHALVCAGYQGRVSSMGIVWVLFAPSPFVDVSAAWGFRSRWARFHTAAAGIGIELFCAGIAANCWSADQSVVWGYWFASIISMAGLSTLVFNANPLMKFDGYFLLSDALDIPNLATQSHRLVFGTLTQLLFDEPAPPCRETGWRRYFLVAYGVLAFCWRVIMTIALLAGISTGFSGAGFAIAAACGLVWLAAPSFSLVKWIYQLARQEPRRAFVGTLRVGILFASCLAGAVFLPWPGGTVCPGIIELSDRARVRVDTEGFVAQWYVQDGDEVSEGCPLLRLVNDDLLTDLVEANLQCDQALRRKRIALEKRELGLVVAEEEQFKSWKSRRDDLELRASHLVVKAPLKGKVYCRDQTLRLGQWVQPGDELLAISSTDDLEFHAYVAQSNTCQIWQSIGQSVEARLSGHGVVGGTLVSIEPCASDRDFPKGLAAPYGGSMAVTYSEDAQKNPGWRLIEPHFHIRVKLEEGARVLAGQTGWLAIGKGNRSVWKTSAQVTEQWFASIQRIAAQDKRRVH